MSLASKHRRDMTIRKLPFPRYLPLGYCNYLIDTGAAVSVLSKSCTNGTVDTSGLPLTAANNTTITTYGTCKRVIDIGPKGDDAWTFIVADIKQPFFGADFLIHYSLH